MALSQITKNIICMIAVACIFSIPLSLHCFRNGGLVPKSVADTESYLFDSLSVSTLLGGIRTPVYPVFVHLCGGFQNARIIVSLQVLIYIAMIWGTFREFSGLYSSRWTAILAVLPFATGSIYIEYANILLPELLAAGFSFRALSLMYTRCGSFSIRREGKLGLLVCLAVLTKPQYLFLVPVSLATLLIASRLQSYTSQLHLWRNLISGTAATTVPLLAYAALRLFAVGHFGLVSFGGANLAGIALNPIFFTEPFVQQLNKPEAKEAAAEILSFRAKLLQRRNEDPSFKLNDTQLDPHQALNAEFLKTLPVYEAISFGYNASVWDVARPAMQSFFEAKGVSRAEMNVRVDRMLSRLSLSSLKYNAYTYVKWLTSAATEAMERCVRYDGQSSRALTIFCLLLGLTSAVSGVVKFWRSSESMRRPAVVFALATALVATAYWGKVSGLIWGVWGWLPGTVAPLLLPAVIAASGLIYAVASFLRPAPSTMHSLHARRLEYVLACTGLYVFAGVGLVIAVEVPLDRYLMVVSPPLVSVVLVCLWFVSSSIAASLVDRGQRVG